MRSIIYTVVPNSKVTVRAQSYRANWWGYGAEYHVVTSYLPITMHGGDLAASPNDSEFKRSETLYNNYQRSVTNDTNYSKML